MLKVLNASLTTANANAHNLLSKDDWSMFRSAHLHSCFFDGQRKPSDCRAAGSLLLVHRAVFGTRQAQATT